MEDSDVRVLARVEIYRKPIVPGSKGSNPMDPGTKGALSILGSFLFSDDDVFKKIKVLSGGERARVSLCRLLNDSHNFLIMDEPTNHLDIHSKKLLKKALIEFDGTLIIVSHDRDFLSNLTTKVYEFSSKKIKEYRGDINSFLQNKNLSNVRQYENTTNNVIAKKKNNNKVNNKIRFHLSWSWSRGFQFYKKKEK